MDLNTGAAHILYDPSTFQPATLDVRFAGSMWDKLDQFTKPIVVVTQPAIDWMYTDVGRASVAIIAAVLIGWFAYILTVRDRRGRGMKQATVSDIFLEAVDVAYLKGQITRAERRKLFKQLAAFFKASDLLDKKQNTLRIKGLIRSRLGNGVYKHKPTIPGAPPLPWETIQEKAKPVRTRMVLRTRSAM